MRYHLADIEVHEVGNFEAFGRFRPRVESAWKAVEEVQVGVHPKGHHVPRYMNVGDRTSSDQKNINAKGSCRYSRSHMLRNGK